MTHHTNIAKSVSACVCVRLVLFFRLNLDKIKRHDQDAEAETKKKTRKKSRHIWSLIYLEFLQQILFFFGSFLMSPSTHINWSLLKNRKITFCAHIYSTLLYFCASFYGLCAFCFLILFSTCSACDKWQNECKSNAVT